MISKSIIAVGLVAILAGTSAFAGGTIGKPGNTVQAIKSASYTQTGPDTVKLDSKPYSFLAGASSNVAFFDNVAITLPTTGRITPSYAEGYSELTSQFQVQYRLLAGLNQAYPAGAYAVRTRFNLDGPGSDDGVPQTYALPIKARNFPDVPKATNFAALQAIDASKPVTLKWTKFADANPKDVITVSVVIYVPLDSSPITPTVVLYRRGFNDALPASATSVTIPAGILPSGYRTVAIISLVHVDSLSTKGEDTAASGVATQLNVPLKIKVGFEP